MGIFSRRQHQDATQPRVASNGGGLFKKRGESPVHTGYTMSKRPTFGQWLKHTWGDILTMVCMGVLGLGIYEARPAPTRSFPVTFSDGEIVYPEFAYPLRKEIIPIWLAAFLAAMIPIVVILVMQIRVRSFWDVNNGILGLLYSLITAAVFQVFIKWLIGGLRPHFLAVCKPDISLATNNPGDEGAPYNGAGFQQLYYTQEICTGDVNEIDDSLESFPSGHTTAAFAGFVYLSLYLNAKLKVFANYHPAMWKLIVIYVPILGAVLIGGALTIDEYHNWYDVFAGAIIGTAMAFSAYRMCYASIWDWRWNHIPLNRTQACAFAHDGMELSDALWTRKAGWGLGGAHHHHHQQQHGNTHHAPTAPTNGAGSTTLPRRAVGAGPPRRSDDMV